jgi:CRP-like cAMP-binding protein
LKDRTILRQQQWHKAPDIRGFFIFEAGVSAKMGKVDERAGRNGTFPRLMSFHSGFVTNFIMMYSLYFQTFNTKVALTGEEQEVIKHYLTVKKLRRKQYLLQEEDVCKMVAFVEKGALRSYKLNEDGSEHIVQFALEGAFMTDLYSFLTNEPSIYNIDAIEDSELVLITKSASDELRMLSPKYQEFIFQATSEAYIQLERRITYTISLSLDERYKQLVANYPDIIQRVPQHMIASYMGLTPETLSRVRKRISFNK